VRLVGKSVKATGKVSPGVEKTVRSMNRPIALREATLPSAIPVKPSIVWAVEPWRST